MKTPPITAELDDYDDLDDVLESPDVRAETRAVGAQRRDATIVAWGQYATQVRIGLRCGHCGGMGDTRLPGSQTKPCEACQGFGWYGIDPDQPAIATAGSSERIVVLAVRFAAGVPLSNEQDDVSIYACERLVDLLSFDALRPAAGPVAREERPTRRMQSLLY